METQESIFDTGYEKEVLEDNFLYAVKKVRKSIFRISTLLLIGDVFGLARANLLTPATFVYSLIVPLVFASTAILTKKRPLVSILILVGLYLALIAWHVYRIGVYGLLWGFLVKAVTVYYFIVGIIAAREAEGAKRKLTLFFSSSLPYHPST